MSLNRRAFRPSPIRIAAPALALTFLASCSTGQPSPSAVPIVTRAEAVSTCSFLGSFSYSSLRAARQVVRARNGNVLFLRDWNVSSNGGASSLGTSASPAEAYWCEVVPKADLTLDSE